MAAKTAARQGVPVSRKRTSRKSPWIRRAKIFLCVAVIVLGIPFIVGSAYFYEQLNWADGQLSNLSEKLSAATTSNPTVIVARDGKTILYEDSEERRDPIEHYEDIPENVIHATLAAEDQRFFEHKGVDFRSLIRSAFTDVRDRRTAQGGSTITMQLAKRVYTSSEKTMTRKVRDVALAMKIEEHLTKKEILKDYLNQVFYGNGAFGIKAASEVYFGKSDLKKLSIAEAALLARCVRRPSDENPFKDPDKAVSNRNDVLGTELQNGWITQDEYASAIASKPHLARRQFGSGETIHEAPYFVRYVLDTVRHECPEIDLKKGGYTIETTLDPSLEKVAETSARDIVAENRRRLLVTTAAFVLLNSDGEILAMVGGIDFLKHQYNAVTQGRRQPGSSFKPIVYSAALSLGVISPGDSISSGAYRYVDEAGNVWEPQNDNGFGGMVSIRTAIASSINTAAARVCEKVGPEKVVEYAHSVFGYTSPLEPVMSIALGSQAVSLLEQARAYSIFQLHGDRAEPFGITRIVAPDGSVVKSYAPNIQRGLLDPEVAAQMDDYLRAVVTSGTATRARSVEDARGKTGTTTDFRDAWFCGYTNNLMGIGWVANEKHDPNHVPHYIYDPMRHVFGGHVPTEMWTRIMKAAQDKYGTGAPQPPKHLERQDMEVDSSADKPIHIDSSQDNSDSTDDSSNQVGDQTDGGVDNGGDNPDNSQKGKAGANATKNAKSQDTADQANPPDTPPVGDSNESTGPPPTPKPARRSRRERSQSTEMVSVEVCADTGLRATIYCPETVVRSFAKGTEPTRYCTKHRP